MPYRVSGSTLTAVERSQLLARWPGTHSRILSGIQRAAETVLGIYLKRTCSRVTSASSALSVLNDYALYKSTHSITHQITHTSYGFTKEIFHIQTIIDSVTYDLFNKVKASNHCFYHLLLPQRPLHDALRVRGHEFQLPNCISSYKFHKQSFIVSSLFRFLK